MKDCREIKEMIEWYEKRYIFQMVNGSNIDPLKMRENLAILMDAYYSYMQFVIEENSKELKKMSVKELYG